MKRNGKRTLKRSILTITGLTAAGIVEMPEPARMTGPDPWLIEQEIPGHTDHDLLVDHIRQMNPQIEPGEDERLARTIIKEAALLRLPETARIDGQPVDPVLFVTSVIETESSFNRTAISRSNARGYMQVMPATLVWIRNRSNLSVDSADIHETEVNVMLGVHYLSYLFDEFHDPALVALAYNAGPGNLRRGFYNPHYWMKVQKFYRLLKKKKAS